jgi:hypothetical protein
MLWLKSMSDRCFMTSTVGVSQVCMRCLIGEMRMMLVSIPDCTSTRDTDKARYHYYNLVSQ